MFLPEHKFYVDAIGMIEHSRNGLHTYLEIILRKPAQRDEFNEARYPDDIFQCTVWNKKIEDLPILEVGDKVTAVLNFQGRKQMDEKNNGEYYYTKQLSIHKLTKL